MKERKVVKTYCSKQDKYFGLTVEQERGRWVVTDFYPMSKMDGKVVASEVTQDSFETRSTLLPCSVDGRRKICSCGSIKCPTPGKYNFQCLYCDKLKISYETDFSGSQYKDGDVIRLSQGQVVKLASSLENIRLDVGWDPAFGVNNMDVDSSVVLYGDQRDHELVYFRHLTDSANSVSHSADNLTGENESAQGNVDEYINIDLKKVPSRYSKIAIVINIYRAFERLQTLKIVKHLFIKLYDAKKNKLLCSYDPANEGLMSTGLILAVLTRSGDSWSFKAVGKSHRVEDIETYASQIANGRIAL